MQPYQTFRFTLSLLEALEIIEVAVWEHVDWTSHFVSLDVQTLVSLADRL